MKPTETQLFVALGSNLGNRLKNLQDAIRLMSGDFQIMRQSEVYETEPWGYEDQPRFLNQVIEAQTSLAVNDVLFQLKKIEKTMGREKTFKNGPRLIDLDLLFYSDQIWQTARLVVPHPHLHERAFVLVPLAEIAPEFRHPILGESIRSLLEKLGSQGVYPYIPVEEV